MKEFEKASVKIDEEIKRDEDGYVIASSTIVKIDIVPDGKKYAVRVEGIPSNTLKYCL